MRWYCSSERRAVRGACGGVGSWYSADDACPGHQPLLLEWFDGHYNHCEPDSCRPNRDWVGNGRREYDCQVSVVRQVLGCVLSELGVRSPDSGSPELSEDIMAHVTGKDCVQVRSPLVSLPPKPTTTFQPMGWTSENVAQDFNISREDMDAFAAM